MKKNIIIGILGILTISLNNSCEEVMAQGEEENTNTDCYQVIVGETEVDDVNFKQLQVDCPQGMRALGAGWSVLDGTGAILDGKATYFQPAYDGAHWLTNATNESGFEPNWKLRVRVICACEDNF